MSVAMYHAPSMSPPLKSMKTASGYRSGAIQWMSWESTATVRRIDTGMRQLRYLRHARSGRPRLPQELAAVHGLLRAGTCVQIGPAAIRPVDRRSPAGIGSVLKAGGTCASSVAARSAAGAPCRKPDLPEPSGQGPLGGGATVDRAAIQDGRRVLEPAREEREEEGGKKGRHGSQLRSKKRPPGRSGRARYTAGLSEPLVGFEPTTARLRIESSTPELQWRGKS